LRDRICAGSDNAQTADRDTFNSERFPKTIARKNIRYVFFVRIRFDFDARIRPSEHLLLRPRFQNLGQPALLRALVFGDEFHLASVQPDTIALGTFLNRNFVHINLFEPHVALWTFHYLAIPFRQADSTNK
jgi:hypothetical protein